ncbi:MAG: chloride channel protein [Bacteriovorax sp.]|nr:chloride channel protein [Bacteriovorax sp.]
MYYRQWNFHLYGKEASKGNNLILEEIHNPKNIVPLRMAPMTLLGTITTHLFGGSAGREGTAVQISASIADNIGKIFKVDIEERKILE